MDYFEDSDDEVDVEMPENDLEEVLKDVKKIYFKKETPGSQTIESYNHFMNHTLPEIITVCGYFEQEESMDPVTMSRKLHKVQVTKVSIEGKTNSKVKIWDPSGETRILYPYEARIRNLNYMKPLYAEFKHQIFQVDGAGHRSILCQGVENVTIGEIPIMVKSEQCSLYGLTEEELIDEKEDPVDPGGYFIINGKEKVLISQEKAAVNKLFIFKPMCDADYRLEAEIRSSKNPSTDEISAMWIRIPGKPSRIEKNPTDFNEARDAENKRCKLPGANGIHANKPFLKRKFRLKHPGLKVHHLWLREAIPLIILFKALGFKDDKSIWDVIGTTDKKFVTSLSNSFSNEDAVHIKTKQDALIFIGRAGKQNASEKYEDRETGAKRVFTNDDYLVRGSNFINLQILPHIGDGGHAEDDALKGIFVGYMVNRLISAYLGRIPCNDRDHLENKRYDLAGPLMATLLKSLIGAMFDEMRQKVARYVENNRNYNFFKQIAGGSTLTKGFLYSFSSGNWCDKRRQASGRVAVCQDYTVAVNSEILMVGSLFDKVFDDEFNGDILTICAGPLFTFEDIFPLNRVTRLASLSFLRRINAPVNRLVRMTAPRMVHNTGYGYICPADTPEGEPVGLLKNLSIMAHASFECDQEPIWKCLDEANFNPIDVNDVEALHRETKIFINANIVGSYPSEKASELVEMLRKRRSEWDEEIYKNNKILKWTRIEQLRREEKKSGLLKGELSTKKKKKSDNEENIVEEFRGISHFCSISHKLEDREIHIRTDGGRLVRPLLKVGKNMRNIRKYHASLRYKDRNEMCWADLVKEGIVEFLDPEEEETALIAMIPIDLIPKMFEYKNTYTHMEISPETMLGVCASLIPFSNHNQSARVTFQCNMAKQAIGIYMLNYNFRYDAESHVLFYPQRPLVTTDAASFSNYDEYPAGINAIVSIHAYTGYNQEDSIIMNASAIQRGFFRSLYFKTKSDDAKVNKGMGDSNEYFERPNPKEIGVRRGINYDHLDEDGLPHVGVEIKDGEPIIGKTQLISQAILHQQRSQGRTSTATKQDISELFKTSCASDVSHVDSVLISNNSEEYQSVKIRLRSSRKPQMGDKFASRHGQKGVMGMDFNEVDLPFTKQGIVPDIILNPHAIPSRMTIGHLLEMWQGKACATKGYIGSGTAFAKRKSKEELIKELEAQGFQKYGDEVMYCGHTGQKIMSPVFIGTCFYQRLKHMTEDKMHFRARGPVTQLCKQPNSGITREGGLRFGEMERDSALSHGGAQFLRERLLTVSDYYVIAICKVCGHTLVKSYNPAPPAPGKEHEVRNSFYKCLYCKSNRSGGVTFSIPYACKLLFQELACMNIKAVMQPEEEFEVKRTEKVATVPAKKDEEPKPITNWIEHIMSIAQERPKFLRDVEFH